MMAVPAGHRPRRRFGQHFLHDRQTITRIVAAVDPRPHEVLVEIGPGGGALTEPLLERAGRLHVVEIDRDLAASLQRRFADHRRLQIHTGDALHLELRPLAIDAGRLRLVGNLPYNISTPLLFHLLAQIDCIADLTFMLQYEVAQRLAAQPGSRDYGRLTVMVRYHCQVDLLLRVPAAAFSPPPKVESALVRMRPRSARPGAEAPTLARVVAAAFGQRRKTLRNALAGLADAPMLHDLAIDPRCRAEALEVDDFVRIAAAVDARRQQVDHCDATSVER